MINLNASRILNDVNAVNSYNEMAAKHAPGSLRPEFFYQQVLEDTIRMDAGQFVHYTCAKVSTIQGKAEQLRIRRWAPLKAHTTPLTEGIPPGSDKGSMEDYTLNAFAYGRYMEFTDRINIDMVDNMVAIYSAEYSIVALETLDLLAREAMLGLGQSYYAGLRPSFDALQIGDIPSIEDLRLIQLYMRKRLVKPFSGDSFRVIGSQEFYFDLMDDPYVEKYMRYNNTTAGVFDGFDNKALPPMFKFEFIQTQHVNQTGVYETANDTILRVVRRNTITGALEYNIVPGNVYYVAAPDNWDRDERTGKEASYIPNRKIWDLDAFNLAHSHGEGDWQELQVDRVLILGADCLYRTELAGEGKVKMIVKSLGSSGVLDPLDQRQSIGFKLNSVGFGVGFMEAITVYNCIPTQLNLL